MKELIIAFGLFLFIEGILYALFPSKMKNMLSKLNEVNDSQLRTGGLVGKVKEKGMSLVEPMMEKVDEQFGEILSLMGAADLPDDEMPPPPKPQRSPNGSSIMRQASSPQVSSTPIRSSESTVPFINLMEQEARKQLNIVKQGQSNLPLEVINFINKIK